MFGLYLYVIGTAQLRRGQRRVLSMRIDVDVADPGLFHWDYVSVVWYSQGYHEMQLHAAAKHGKDNAVVWNGNVAMVVNRYFTDTWVNTKVFRLDILDGTAVLKG